MNEFVFPISKERNCKLTKISLEKMLRYRQNKPNTTEAGGILIGRIILDSHDVVIDDVSEPMAGDIRKPKRFKRSRQGHQAYFNKQWRKNSGRCFYLGEWHTHPESSPKPSIIDYTDWMRILHIGHESETLFFIIVGIKEICIWFGKRNTNQILRVNVRGDLYE